MNRMRLLRRRLIPQFSCGEYCICSEDHFVYRYEYGSGYLTKVCRIPSAKGDLASILKDRIARSFPIRVLRRNVGLTDVVILPSGTLLIFYDKLYRYVGSKGYAEPIVSFESANFSPPLNNGVAVNIDNGCIYFGEYQNNRPYSVKIMRVWNDGKDWEICYRFPKGKVKHVHSITWDPYRNRIWICTGDDDAEVGFFYTDDDFQSVHLFGGGDQSWRMVSVIPTERYLIWGSDAGKDAPADAVNYIYLWDFSKNRRERLACIDNPAYYSAMTSDGFLILGTTYEPGMKRKTSETAEIWISKDSTTWRKVVSIPYKRARRQQGTKYATIYLPNGVLPAKKVYFSPINVDRMNFCLVGLDLEDYSNAVWAS